jgi:hypothetical protein
VQSIGPDPVEKRTTLPRGRPWTLAQHVPFVVTGMRGCLTLNERIDMSNESNRHRAARQLVKERGISYQKALSQLDFGESQVADSVPDNPSIVLDPDVLFSVVIDDDLGHSEDTFMEVDLPRELAGIVATSSGQVIWHSPEGGTWVVDRVGGGGTELAWYVESGSGDRLSEDLADESKARAIARQLRERLIFRSEVDSSLEADELVFDYGAHNGVDPDDIGATRCTECGAWTVELVDPGHDISCSLRADNVGQVDNGLSCRFCHNLAGADYHIAGVVADGENNVVCDNCWDERLR